MLLRTIAILAAFTVACAVPVPAQALDKAGRICAAAKLKATAKNEKAQMKCETKALLAALPATDPECLGKADSNCGTAFGKAEERGGCVSQLDTGNVKAAVDVFVANQVEDQTVFIAPPPPCDVLNEACGTCGDGVCALTDDGQLCVTTTGGVGPCPEAGCPDGWACIRMEIWNPFPIPIPEISVCLQGCGNQDPIPLDESGRRCAAAKLTATSKKVHSKLKCEAKGILQELAAADPECLGKADTKFGLAFGKAEEKGGCFSVGDAAEIETAADTFVSNQVVRQKTGTGVDLPTCPTPDVACGSCGDGVCASLDEGQFCISPAGYVSPCPVDGCVGGTVCITGMGMSACVTPCP